MLSESIQRKSRLVCRFGIAVAIVLSIYLVVSCMRNIEKELDRFTLSQTEVDQLIRDEGEPTRAMILDHKRKNGQYPASIDKLDLSGLSISKKWRIQTEDQDGDYLVILIFSINIDEKLLCYIESPSGERGWYFSGDSGIKRLAVGSTD